MFEHIERNDRVEAAVGERQRLGPADREARF
jgi:hypothetical protein